MLAMSKDQQLYKKAYNDYSDLDDDGALETTYKHTIDYYGYFDPYKCYTYDTTNNWYTPVAAASYSVKPSDCSGNWSGNFLNWVSMSRIDAVRKLLYGGKRFLDEASSTTTKRTVVERSYIPTDAHAWAKYYLPDAATPTLTPAINQLTPFNPATTPPTGAAAGSNSAALPRQRVHDGQQRDEVFSERRHNSVCIGDQVKLAIDMPVTYMHRPGVLPCLWWRMRHELPSLTSAPGELFGSGALTTDWTLTNLTATGITFCNATLGGASPLNKSQTNTNPPLIRAALGNYSLWSANERFQCIRYSETTKSWAHK
jgi:type IV pilus assembly protein PilY1